jgi:alpha-tubulin suppressor-like RCC1 family protein
MILETDGTLWATGDNEYRQLGDGTTTTGARVQVDARWTGGGAGVWHNMILKTDGTLWATGYNLNGQLGAGTGTNRSTHRAVMRDVKAAAADQTYHDPQDRRYAVGNRLQ